jgi:cytochrome c oxidase cbb3-type subunit III
MRNYVGVIAAWLLALNLLGCKQQSVAVAPMGTPPPVRVPVGPVPGPGNKYENLPANPYEGDQVAMVEGRRLFIWYNCYGCHGGHAGGGMGPSLRDPVWLYGSAPAEIFSSIAEGRGKGMPAWGTKIPQDQIWKLVTYIKTLNTSQEVDPPLVAPKPEVKPSPALAKEAAELGH